MTTVYIPTPLRRLTAGQSKVTVEAETISSLLSALDVTYPGIAERVLDGDGNVKRALYSDAGLAVVKFRRCVVINGIDLGALRGDWRHAHRECRALAYP